MKAWLCGVLGLWGTLLAFPRGASACSCGVPGIDSALTGQSDTWGARVAERFQAVSGRWDSRGNYRALGRNGSETRYDLFAMLAYRPWPRLELSSTFDYARASLVAGGLSESLTGAGDAFLRSRFEALDEAPPHRDGFPMPALAFTASVGAPTGRVASGESLGLGAWEAAVAGSAERSITSRLRVGATVEGGFRTPDDSLGVSRQLGPRLTTALVGWYWPSSSVVLSLSSRLTWEGGAAIAGRVQPGSETRQLGLGAGLAFRPFGSSFRSGFALQHVPALARVGVNSAASSSLEISLAYTQ